MKKSLSLIVYITSILSGTSCSHYLDKEFDASLSEEKVFGNATMTREFLTNIYTNLPDGIGIYNDPQFLGASRDCMTDNSVSFWGLHYYTKIATDNYTATDHPLLGFWGNNFNGIRKCNQFLKYVDPTNPNNPHPDKSVISNSEVPGDDNHLRDRYVAEAKFMRALFHFELVDYFGNTPILENQIFDLSDQAAMNTPRKDAAEVLKWIADQCDAIKDVLPFRYSSDGNWGRINGAAAYALKSRALLYRASALHNSSNDKSWWTEAANAAKDFITKNTASVTPFKLYPDYQKSFYETPYQNDELILSRSIWYTNAIETNLLPYGFSGCSGRTNPTQNFVDSYEMSNGKMIDEAGSGYNPQKPYDNRDPRLEATIFHEGSVWGRADYNEQRAIDVTTGGKDYRGDLGGTFTGYYLKKFVNPDMVMQDKKTFAHVWVIYRYAEILLNYAEALNEAGATSSEVSAPLNEVRKRAGQPELAAGLSQDALRKKIRNERRVELCFEDHRFFDLRRWKAYEGVTATNETSKPRYEQLLNLYVTTVTATGGVPKYTGTTVNQNVKDDNIQTRVFNSPKNYLFPIPYNEVVKAPNLVQNQGW
ncbi:Starch-binding associating with outer membrane [bacterium A37T11]|nr:Starch-binding associating with outer membrane [bacterium A37T11]